MKRSKKQVQADLNLAAPPDDELMELLHAVGTGEVVRGPRIPAHARGFTSPERMEAEVRLASVGAMLAAARGAAGLTQEALGQRVGVSKGRIQQLEHSENIELHTLDRVASALGLQVDVRLLPADAGAPAYVAPARSVPA